MKEFTQEKTRRSYHHSFVFILWALCCLNVGVSAQETAFNFQGRLSDGGNPANGNFELQFRLFDSLAGGNQIGGIVDKPDVAVINGMFSTQLDFGDAAFDGAARFVEIGVRPAGNPNPFIVLAPRQPVLSTPYAIQSKNAARLGGVDASEYVTSATVGTSFIRNGTTPQTGAFNISGNGFFGGNVGIGTDAPNTRLQVATSGYGITQTSGGVTVGSFISTAGGGSGWFGTRSNHPLNFFTNDGLPQLTLSTAGNLGIGTTTPSAKLEVLNGTPGATGIYGESASGRGVWGKSVGSRGVYGESSSLEGVYGISGSGAGVAGRSSSNSGVYGESAASNPLIVGGAGLYGKSTGGPRVGLGPGGVGVYGEGGGAGIYGVTNNPSGAGVYASSGSGGRALLANGNVTQDLGSGGLVKAMAFIRVNVLSANVRAASIDRCYNSANNSSTGDCGITFTQVNQAGVFINFGFPIDTRFISLTPTFNTAVTVDTFINSTTVNIVDNGGSVRYYIYVF
jgi:hypothetical protein